MNIIQKSFLASVMFEPSLVSILIEVSEEHFSGYEKRIYQEIVKLANQDKPFNLVILADRLQNEVPPQHIVSLSDFLCHTNLKYLEQDARKYSKILRNEKVASEMISKYEKFIKNPAPFSEFFNDIKNDFSRVSLSESDVESGNIKECFSELNEINSDDKSITIGIPSLDRVTGGFRFGELVCFMARTAVGKTFLALNVINNMQRSSNDKVAFFSLEMNKPSLLERLCQIRFSISREEALEKLRKDDSYEKLICKDFNNLFILTQNYSTDEIEEKIKSLEVKVVFIDYLDLIRNRKGSDKSRYERASDLIVELKRIAKRQNVLIIILHQLQRQAEDGSVPVKLTMARDSGVIEETSDFIIGAWRPEIGYIDQNSVPEDMSNRLFLKVIKNKRGPVKIAVCFFDHNKTGKIWEIGNNDIQ